MSTETFVAVVTGANKGIGYEITRKLCQFVKQFNENRTGVVYLCSRNMERGLKAIENLKEEYQSIPQLLQLDVLSEQSIATAVATVKEEHGRVNVLALNAGFAFKRAATDPASVQFRDTFAVNYFGVRRCFDLFMPIMSPSGRVVVTSSVGGRMSWDKTSEENRKRLVLVKTVEELDELAEEVINLAREGTVSEKGWADSAYGNSKLFVTKLTEIEAEKSCGRHPNLLINCCCPGWCKTDMAGWEQPPKSAEEGAVTPFMLCTLPEESGVSGRFYSENCDVSYLSG